MYPWQSCNGLDDKKEKTDKRREELLNLMYDSDSEVEGIRNYHNRHAFKRIRLW